MNFHMLFSAIVASMVSGFANTCWAEAVWSIGVKSQIKFTQESKIHRPDYGSVPETKVIKNGVRCQLADTEAPLDLETETISANKIRVVTFVNESSGSVMMIDNRLRVECNLENDMYASVEITPDILSEFFQIEVISNTGILHPSSDKL